MLTSVLFESIDSLFPPQCLLCNRFLPFGSLCNRCTPKISPEAGIFPHHMYLHQYSGPTKKLLRMIKYQNHPKVLGEWLRQISPSIGERLICASYDLIVPIVPSTDHLFRRGFDVAQIISKQVAVELGSSIGRRVLKRTRKAPPQATLSRKRRWKNVENLFKATTDLTGQRVLIVDDVVTTGATMTEAARALRCAGAETIHFFSLAARPLF